MDSGSDDKFNPWRKKHMRRIIILACDSSGNVRKNVFVIQQTLPDLYLEFRSPSFLPFRILYRRKFRKITNGGLVVMNTKLGNFEILGNKLKIQ
jgi:hypothetical protein